LLIKNLMSGTRKRASIHNTRPPMFPTPLIRRLTRESVRASHRRISAIVGIHYNILVSIDETDESWRALNAVLYLFDSAKDILNTVTINDINTPKGIRSKIKRVVTANFPDLDLWQLCSTIVNENNEPTKQRILDMVSKHNYDLFAVGMPGSKNDAKNPLRIFDNIMDLSLRASKCTTLISPSGARIPFEDESAVYVVVIDESTTDTNTYETVRAWMREGDYLHLIQVKDPREEKPDSQIKMRTFFMGRQYALKLSDREKGDSFMLTGNELVPAIIKYCNQAGAHFLFCGADQMWTWANNAQMGGPSGDALVRACKCFLIICRLNFEE